MVRLSSVLYVFFCLPLIWLAWTLFWVFAGIMAVVLYLEDKLLTYLEGF